MTKATMLRVLMTAAALTVGERDVCADDDQRKFLEMIRDRLKGVPYDFKLAHQPERSTAGLQWKKAQEEFSSRPIHGLIVASWCHFSMAVLKGLAANPEER